MGTRLTYRRQYKRKNKKAKYLLLVGKTYRIPKQEVQKFAIVHTYRKFANVNNGAENK